jgi:hypothetical protein
MALIIQKMMRAGGWSFYSIHHLPDPIIDPGFIDLEVKYVKGAQNTNMIMAPMADYWELH